MDNKKSFSHKQIPVADIELKVHIYISQKNYLFNMVNFSGTTQDKNRIDELYKAL